MILINHKVTVKRITVRQTVGQCLDPGAPGLHERGFICNRIVLCKVRLHPFRLHGNDV